MAKIGNELKVLQIINYLYFRIHHQTASPWLPSRTRRRRCQHLLPQICLSHSEPRTATGHIQTRWQQP